MCDVYWRNVFEFPLTNQNYDNKSNYNNNQIYFAI